MKRVPAYLAAAIVALIAAAGSSAAGGVTDAQIQEARNEANDCMRSFGLRAYDVSKAKPLGAAYRRWVLLLWQVRASTCRLLLIETRNPTGAINVVFGDHAADANRVASCESGHSTTAQNGQYLGMFQMGSSERATYGHGDTPLDQARAAHRYFVASGRDWSPWTCKPW